SDLPSSLLPIWGDKDRLRQVVLNLLSNASKFMDGQGSITLRARQNESELLVEVEDTGPGMDEAEQRRLFRAYERLVGHRDHYSGLGLGLALSKTIIELHGSRVWVKSQQGKGNGGDIGFIARGRMIKEFEDAGPATWPTVRFHDQRSAARIEDSVHPAKVAAGQLFDLRSLQPHTISPAVAINACFLIAPKGRHWHFRYRLLLYGEHVRSRGTCSGLRIRPGWTPGSAVNSGVILTPASILRTLLL
ncbi:MAG: ATP-binding protein, partial [Chloroflexi bacterium]|nr:ATP-binding protein [Chloroflexota bacterium]